MELLVQWAPVIIVLLTAVFNGGRFTNRIKQVEERVDKHDIIFEKHDNKFEEIDEHDKAQDIALVKLEYWRDGWNAAKALFEKKQEKSGGH